MVCYIAACPESGRARRALCGHAVIGLGESRAAALCTSESQADRGVAGVGALRSSVQALTTEITQREQAAKIFAVSQQRYPYKSCTRTEQEQNARSLTFVRLALMDGYGKPYRGHALDRTHEATHSGRKARMSKNWTCPRHKTRQRGTVRVAQVPRTGHHASAGAPGLSTSSVAFPSRHIETNTAPVRRAEKTPASRVTRRSHGNPTQRRHEITVWSWLWSLDGSAYGAIQAGPEGGTRRSDPRKTTANRRQAHAAFGQTHAVRRVSQNSAGDVRIIAPFETHQSELRDAHFTRDTAARVIGLPTTCTSPPIR